MATEVESEIAGSVWKLEKRAGEPLAAGEVILVIESMKMEIPVEAPCAGTLAELRVAEGDEVSEGMVLAVIA